jgi:O-acetylserine/cysteine efflux transporter
MSFCIKQYIFLYINKKLDLSLVVLIIPLLVTINRIIFMLKRDIFILIFLNVVWGSAFAISGYGLKYFAPTFMYALRFFIAGVAVAPFCKFPGENIKKIFFLSMAQAFVFYGVGLAVKNLDSSISAIVSRLDILFTIILAMVIFKEKMTMKLVTSLAMCTIAIIIINGEIRFSNSKYLYLLIFSSFMSGVANIIAKGIKDEKNTTIVAWSSLLMGIELGAISFLTESRFILEKIDVRAVLVMSYLSIFSSYIAYMILFSLLRRYEASKIMPYNFSRPIIAIIAGYLILGEAISYDKVLGTALIIVGIFIAEHKGDFGLSKITRKILGKDK